MVDALQRAGSTGVRVSDLAKSLGIKRANAFAWFHAAQSRYPQIKKMARGQYRLEGTLPDADAAPRNTPARATQSRQNGQGRTRKTGRGELKQGIVDALSSAGAKGLSIRELAEKTGAPYKNVSVWLSTTGKKLPNLKKLAPGVFQLG